jgi:hypothetical protein
MHFIMVFRQSLFEVTASEIEKVVGYKTGSKHKKHYCKIFPPICHEADDHVILRFSTKKMLHDINNSNHKRKKKKLTNITINWTYV